MDVYYILAKIQNACTKILETNRCEFMIKLTNLSRLDSRWMSALVVGRREMCSSLVTV